MSLIGDLAEIDAIEEVKPISEDQWKRILGPRRRFRVLVKVEQQQWAGKNAVRCISCKNAHKSAGGHDPWRAHCGVHSLMVGDAFPKLCRQYEPN